MRFLLFAFAATVSLVTAKAPLHVRGAADAIRNNYIVALKPHITATKAKGFYKSLKTTSSKKLSVAGFRGVTNTFDHVAYNAFHVECDDDTLDSIRKSPAVCVFPVNPLPTCG